MRGLKKLTDLLDDMASLGYFEHAIPNKNIAQYLLKHDVGIIKHSYWKESLTYIDQYKCGCCGKITYSHSGYPNFCPNCGTKMDIKRKG